MKVKSGLRARSGRRALGPSARKAALVLAVVLSGCVQRWETKGPPVRDEELDAAFFAGLDTRQIVDVPEPTRLRPCCIFGHDVGVLLGALPLPGYEVRNVLDVTDLGEHRFNKGAVALETPGAERLFADEKSGVLYTCRGGFIDIAHVRDNADRTLYLASQIARMAVTGGTIPLAGEGAERRIVVKPLDAGLVRSYGLREVAVSLAEWLDYQASIWHEITTWYGWSSTAFPERPSAFSPEDLYSNLLGVKITGAILRRNGAASSEANYDRSVTAFLKDAIVKLGPLPKDASRRAFEYVDGIWWDSTKRVPDNQLVRHRNFDIGPKLYPWKLRDAQITGVLEASGKEFEQACAGDYTALGLGVPDSLGGVPFRQMATLEIRPGETVVKNGFPFPSPDRTVVTPDDFPAIIRAIEQAADAELGPGTGRPAARPGETSRAGQ